MTGADLIAAQQNFGNTAINNLFGDSNNDGLVSGLDLISVQQNFGNAEPGDPTGLLPGDANDDGFVSGLDLISVQQNFGDALAATGDPVPEPTTVMLLVGCFSLLARRHCFS